MAASDRPARPTDREARLAAALRANLHRRKAQAKAKTKGQDEGAGRHDDATAPRDQGT